MTPLDTTICAITFRRPRIKAVTVLGKSLRSFALINAAQWQRETLFRPMATRNVSDWFLNCIVHQTHSTDSFADQVMGIYGCTLFETLHAINHGLIRYHVEALHNIIEEKTVGKAEKALYNQYFRTIITYLARQSEQEFPRGSSRSPYTNNTYMTAGEHRGNQVFSLSAFTLKM